MRPPPPSPISLLFAPSFWCWEEWGKMLNICQAGQGPTRRDPGLKAEAKLGIALFSRVLAAHILKPKITFCGDRKKYIYTPLPPPFLMERVRTWNQGSGTTDHRNVSCGTCCWRTRLRLPFTFQCTPLSRRQRPCRWCKQNVCNNKMDIQVWEF